MNTILVNLFDYTNLNKNSTPLGILSLATKLQNNRDFNVKVLDFHRIYESKILKLADSIDENILNTMNYILEFEPDVVGFYSLCSTHLFAIIIAKLIKSANENITIIFGGPQATLTAKETIEKFDFIDMVGLYEGETTIEKILYGIRDKDISSIEGLCYRDGNSIIVNNNVNLIENLDELPIIDYELLGTEIKGSLSIEVGRGCPFECTYCSTQEFWERKFRLKSNKRILDEIMHYKNKYGVTEFDFVHDLFTLSKKRVVEICQMFIDNKLDITWKCSSRLDTLDDEMMKIMAEAGCRRIFFGIETGSERMQKLIKKNLKLVLLTDLVKNLKKYGISSAFCFIYGFPEETEEDVNDTLKLMYNICQEYRGKPFNKMLELQLFMLSFLPKTQLTKKYFRDLEFKEEYLSHFIGFYSVIETDNTVDHNKQIWNFAKQIARNKEIFPQHFEYKSQIRVLLKNLDKYYLFILPKLLNNFDMTYKLIIDFFKENHIQFFLEIDNFLCQDNPEIWSFNNLKSNLSSFDIISIFGRFISKFDFGNEKELIMEMYNLEKSILSLVFNRNNTNQCIEQIYNFDVYRMKKNRNREVVKSKNKLSFIIKGDKYYVEQQSIIYDQL